MMRRHTFELRQFDKEAKTRLSKVSKNKKSELEEVINKERTALVDKHQDEMKVFSSNSKDDLNKPTTTEFVNENENDTIDTFSPNLKRNLKKERKKSRQRQANEDLEKRVEQELGKLGESGGELEAAYFDKVCETENLKMGKVNPSGDCLFASVAAQVARTPGLFQDNTTSEKLRESVCTFMELFREDYEPFIVETDFDSYIEKMRQPAEWGGELELKAISELLRVHIRVFRHLNGTNGSITDYFPGGFEGPNFPQINLSYHTKLYSKGLNHYNPLYKN